MDRGALLTVRCGLLGVMLLVVVLVVSAAPARAHSFLAATEPLQGARLAEAPDDLALQFSEAVSVSSARLVLRRPDGGAVPLPAPRTESGAQVVRVRPPQLQAGVYVASWHVTSAVDGHESAGEFAFAVGTAARGIPATARVSTDVDVSPLVTTGTWLFFTGLAVAAGGVAGSWLLQSGRTGERWLAHGAWVTAGALVGLVGVAVRLIFEAATLGWPVLPASALLVGAALALGVAALTAWLSSRWPSVLMLTGAAAAWAGRSHAAATGGLLGWLVDVAHLLAGALWTGPLVYLAVILWRRRHEDRRELLDEVRRYARFAAPVVAVLAGTGMVAAYRLLPDLPALWTDGYGRIIVVKTGLFLAALLAAWSARVRALPSGRQGLLQWLTAVEAGAVVAVLAVAAVLANAVPPTPAVAAESLLGPRPIDGPAVRTAGLAGALTVEIAAGDRRLDVAVVSPSGGVEGTRVQLEARYPNGTRAELHPRPCGAGCYTQPLALPAGDTILEVVADAPEWTGGTLTAQLHWPPPVEEPTRFGDMIAAMRSVRAVRVVESVSSGAAGTGARPAAPSFELTGEEFIALMPYANGGVAEVRGLPEDPEGFSFYLAGSNTYFAVRVDNRGRLVEQRMVNRGHEIDYRFTYAQTHARTDSDATSRRASR